jgi:flagellar basal-body rod modification protein FlgD
MDYMKLLVTELQHQDPLEPLDNKEMASQLAQLSQLQQLETINSNFSAALSLAQKGYANSLIGKEVWFADVGDDGSTQAKSGTVEQVYNDVDGEVVLSLGDQTVSLADVLSVGKSE